MRRISLFTVILLCAVSSFAQSGYTWRTARDIGEGARGVVAGTVVDVGSANRLQIEMDSDQSRVNVETDSVATQYNGFGGVINGKPEIYTGTSGFANVRTGDRIEVRGTGRGTGAVVADQVTLLGRSVSASQVGVGQTRSPSSIGTSTDDRPTGTVRSDTTSRAIEGTVRSIGTSDGRVVIQTTDRRMITIRTSRTTPVYYRDQQYRVTNLEVGDRISVTQDPRDTGYDDVTATRIDVLQSVDETTTGGNNNGGVVTTLQGRVNRIDASGGFAFVDVGRDEVRVDMTRAEDATGHRIGASDLRIGDRVDVSGSYNRAGDTFVATTVRYTGAGGDYTPLPRDNDYTTYATVTIIGTVQSTLDDETMLVVKERDTNRTLRLWALEDLAVRTKAGTYTTASTLRVNDTVTIKAFRDPDGTLIAQTVRLRSR
ncbi:MAG TPA: DUF5666 domain-containing protein [Thermoanaerobaculia bacterium]|nr:DUF5666 domain-containing protein [Thermoanaerobaculia bacterium]